MLTVAVGPPESDCHGEHQVVVACPPGRRAAETYQWEGLSWTPALQCSSAPVPWGVGHGPPGANLDPFCDHLIAQIRRYESYDDRSAAHEAKGTWSAQGDGQSSP